MTTARARRRRWLLRLHRWLGLGGGPLFVLLGLTGSLLVFYVEIDAAIEPALAVPGPTPVVTAWQPVLDALQQAHPERLRGWRIELPPDGRGLVTARYLRPEETEGRSFAPLMVTVNPQTDPAPVVLVSRFWGDFAATWVYDLHYSLLAGGTGVYIVAAVGTLFVISLVAGLWLWWPRPGHWRAALRMKLRGSPQRRHYDLHKAFGLGSAGVLLVLGLTGVLLALPGWVGPAVQSISPTPPMPVVTAPREPGRALIPLDAVLARTQAHWPEALPRWIDTPAADSAVFRVRLWLPGDPSRRFPRSYLWLDGHEGTVLAERDARRHGAGDKVMAWLHPLHNGEAFGLAGRVTACVAGLVPLALALTGWWRWRDRRRAGLERLRQHRGRLPAGFEFDRMESQERR